MGLGKIGADNAGIQPTAKYRTASKTQRMHKGRIRPYQVSQPETTRLTVSQVQPKFTSSVTSAYAYLIS